MRPPHVVFAALALLAVLLAAMLAGDAFSGALRRDSARNGEGQADSAIGETTLAWSRADAFAAAAPRIATGQVDSLGRPVTVSCASCHANFESSRPIASADEIQEFHRGLRYEHGTLTCQSCHHPDNYNVLRLADNQPLDFADSRQLCSQCHANQARDYARGAHGGMTGYWQESQGSRQRKDCIDCHDPHAPKFPAMIPTFHPHDRFLTPPHDQGEDAHE